jgi:hypothetical protein
VALMVGSSGDCVWRESRVRRSGFVISVFSRNLVSVGMKML